jgi:CheY-like chemotaxis protein
MSESQTIARRAVRSSSAPLTSVAVPHVLIADADANSRALREAQLSAVGFRVSVARTPFETIVKASCQVPDLILLDESVADGEIDTAEISRLLTTCPVTAHIPVLRLTSRRRLPQRLLADLRRSAIA